MPLALRSLPLFRSRSIASLLAVLVCAAPIRSQGVSSAASGLRPVSDRLTQPIQESNRVALQGTLHPLANRANDLGAVGDGMKLDRIQVVLKRSDAQESALKQLIGDLHAPGSASYHKWLTPDDFGKRFGPSDGDVAKLESWLGSHGFSIAKLNPGRQTLEISGTAGQFRDAFHTQIHGYRVKGAAASERHFANASAPEIPAALAPVFGGFASLNNFHLKHHAKVLGRAQFNPATHEAKPEWTVGTANSFNLVLAPGDFAAQYDLNPVYAETSTLPGLPGNGPITGTGQSIAIVNESNINVALVNAYRTLFGLPANPPAVIIDGNDPGIDGNNSPYGQNFASGEAYLDVELAGAVAPTALVNLVIADSTALEDGLTLAMERAVYSNISPIISLSFGGCEADQGSYNAFVSGLWEQAAAQGITVLVSSGDQGSAGCDDDNSQYFAVRGQAVNGLASTPYNVAVGGTDFYYSGGASQLATYWNVAPTPNTPTVSLKSKVPEQPWNDSQYGLNLYSVYTSSGDTETSIAGGGGGASTAGLLTGSTYGPYPKPSWQTGTGVPADNARDLPDVSLFAANGLNDSYYPICASDGDCASGTSTQITGIGGTSASTPAFAGIMALVNQKYGRQGQANFVLYPLAAQFPSAFNDVTAGTNAVPCATSTVTDSNGKSYPVKNCQTVAGPLSITDPVFGTTFEGEIGFAANTYAYNAGTGYDLASGLGTVDAANLVNNWGNVTFAATTTTLTPSAASFAHGTAVTISGTVTGSSPTGNVALLTSSTDPNKQGDLLFPLTAGAYSGSGSTLPGGTYNIYGYYGGDNANAPSTSPSVQISVTPEASTTALTVYAPTSSNSSATLASGGSVSYGAITSLSTKESGATSGTASTVPTGSVAFLDGASTINTTLLNAEGNAEYGGPFAVGAHSITAKYSGDSSYGASASSATAFTVVANTPVFYVSYPNADSNNDAVGGQTTYVAVQVENSSAYANSQALPPNGTVTVSGAPAGVGPTATLVPSVDPYGNVPEGTAYFAFPSGTTGTLPLTFTFTPTDSNYATATATQSVKFVGSAGAIATTTSASASLATTSPAAAVVVTVQVAAPSGDAAPTGTVALYASEELVGSATLPTATGNLATVTISLASGGLPPGTNQITAQYYPASGSTYIGSAAVITIANPLSDFSLVPVTTIITGTEFADLTDVINLNSFGGFSGNVNLTCNSLKGYPCSFSANSVTLVSGGTASVTLIVDTSALTPTESPALPVVVVTGTDVTGQHVHTIALQMVSYSGPTSTAPGFTLSADPTAVAIASAGSSGTAAIGVTPENGFTGTVTLTCAVTGNPAGAPTCPAATAPATLTFNTTSATPAGTYTVLVTGTSGSLTATTVVTVTVAVTPPGIFAVTKSADVTIATQGGTGTSTISVVSSPMNPYSGSVALTCAVTASPSGATEIPTCSLSPASVTLAGNTVTSALTINTTAQTGTLEMPLKGIFTVGGGVALATLLLFGAPAGRRGRRPLEALRILSVAVLFALIASAGMGCGGGSSSGGGGGGGGGGTTPTGGTTIGTYTVTVTGTPGSGQGTAASTVAVSVIVN